MVHMYPSVQVWESKYWNWPNYSTCRDTEWMMMCGPWGCRRGQNLSLSIMGTSGTKQHTHETLPAQPVTQLIHTHTHTRTHAHTHTNTHNCCTQSERTGRRDPMSNGKYFLTGVYHFLHMYLYLFIFFLILNFQRERERENPEGFVLSL